MTSSEGITFRWVLAYWVASSNCSTGGRGGEERGGGGQRGEGRGGGRRGGRGEGRGAERGGERGAERGGEREERLVDSVLHPSTDCLPRADTSGTHLRLLALTHDLSLTDHPILPPPPHSHLKWQN